MLCWSTMPIGSTSSATSSFCADYGQHFTINRMLTFDSVRLRLEREQPLTFLEFNYMVMQAYDFLELARRHDCRLQMGGSDQWGNIVNGVELARRVDGRSVHGLTTPLITTATGAKMGKTAAGAVWLNEDRLPGFDYWQYWRNTDDADVGRFLRLFTDLPARRDHAARSRCRAARSTTPRRSWPTRRPEALSWRGRRRSGIEMLLAPCSSSRAATARACRRSIWPGPSWSMASPWWNCFAAAASPPPTARPGA